MNCSNIPWRALERKQPKGNKKAAGLVRRSETEYVRSELLLLAFFLRIALLANLLGLGGFNAALVGAFLASLLCVIAAARLEIGGTDSQRESAQGQCQQLDALHFSFLG
jgi:hypothetical protein